MLFKKLIKTNKTNFFLLIISALLFSYSFTLTFTKQRNLSYHKYNIIIDDSLGKYDHIKKHILNKVYGDLFNIISNSQRFSLYARYPNVDHWRAKGFVLSNQKIDLDQFINQYEKTLKSNVYFECADLTAYEFDLKSCLNERNLWLNFNDNKKYFDFFNKNIKQKKSNNINNKFFFLRCLFIFLIFFFLYFLFFKKVNQENKI